jgi:hypothetical protein
MKRFNPIRRTPRAGAHGASPVVTVLLTLLLAFGYGPAIEVHGHAAGDAAHVHDDAGLAPLVFGSEHSQPHGEGAVPVQHCHGSAPINCILADAVPHEVGDPRLTSSQLPVVASGSGIEPPAPPNRPPILIHG